MPKTKFYDSGATGKMNVAGLMSGSGTNLVKIIEHERTMEEDSWSPYRVSVIFSDRYDSKAYEIGRQFDIPVITRDISAFYRARNRPRSDMEVRAEFDAETIKSLSPFEIDVAAYAGYMSIATDHLMSAFLGVNVHPGDLRVVNENGRRKYVGDDAVGVALRDRSIELRSTTHVIEPEVDGGRIFVVSNPVLVSYPEGTPDYPQMTDQLQTQLKETGDWDIFPKTLEAIARGRFAEEGKNSPLYFNGNPIPNGITVDQL